MTVRQCETEKLRRAEGKKVGKTAFSFQPSAVSSQLSAIWNASRTEFNKEPSAYLELKTKHLKLERSDKLPCHQPTTNNEQPITKN